MLSDDSKLPGDEGQDRLEIQTWDAPSRQPLIDEIKAAHRHHRHAIKHQSRLARSLEAEVRDAFGFRTNLPEPQRKKISAQAIALIKQCRAGTQSEEHSLIAMLVIASDQSRSSWDAIVLDRKKALERAARKLPGYDFVKGTRGAGDLGFAQIIGEAGDLSNYANPGKLWKRLGLAPYDGHAMSSWMRETWRPRKLTSEEWIANPFKPERYAIIAQIATWLVTAQCEAKEKSGTKHGRPKGRYGEFYVGRREHTDITHQDWSDGHARADALRYTVKKFTRDLWVAWRRASGELKPMGAVPGAEISAQADGSVATKMVKSSDGLPPPDNSSQEERPANSKVKSTTNLPDALKTKAEKR